MQRGIIGKFAAYVAERLHEIIHVAERLDTQGSVNQVARLQETQPGGKHLKERGSVVIQLVKESE